MNEDLVNYINDIRRDFAGHPLDEGSVLSDPMKQFAVWFEEAVNAQLLDPSAYPETTKSVAFKETLIYLTAVHAHKAEATSQSWLS